MGFLAGEATQGEYIAFTQGWTIDALLVYMARVYVAEKKKYILMDVGRQS